MPIKNWRKYPDDHVGVDGNKNIRKSKSKWEYTAEEIQEIVKCAENPRYFMNYVMIKHVDFEELISFQPRFYQEEMIDKIIDYRNVIIKLPRQCGKTTCVAALILWHAIFKKNYSILVAAHQADKSRDILAVIKEMFENLPPFLQLGVSSVNEGRIKLENGSRIKASATTASSARGDTYNMIYLDEFAFVQKHLADGFVKSVMPTISSGKYTKTIITSTPQGLNFFHTMWEAAVNKKSDFQTVEIKWNDVPGRDDVFRDHIIATYGQSYFDQEYGAEFIGSGLTLIAGHHLLRIKHRIKDPLNSHNMTRVYEMPEKGKFYAVTVDVAEGLGGDSSAISVFDISQTPYRHVAVFQNNEIDEVSLAGIVFELARAYNEALVLIESNFGGVVGNTLWVDYEYGNMVRTMSKKQTQKATGGNVRARIGVNMNTPTKRAGCARLKLLIEQDQLILPDMKTYDELTHFAVDGKTYKADSGHDDLVMSLVLFAWLHDQGYVEAYSDVSARAAIVAQNKQKVEDEVLPLGFSSHDVEVESFKAPINDARWINDDAQKSDFERLMNGNWDAKKGWI